MKKISIAVIDENGVPLYQTETMVKHRALMDIRDYLQPAKNLVHCTDQVGPYFRCPTCGVAQRNKSGFGNFCPDCGQKLQD